LPVPEPQRHVPVLGERVSVRYQLPGIEPLDPGPHFTDVVGELVGIEPGSVTVRGRTGDVVVARAAVVAVRVVPPRPSRPARPHRALTPEALQRLMVAGSPPIETGWIGGWLLRAAGGFTGRANSMLPLGDPGLPLAEAIVSLEAWYRSRSLAPLVTIFGELGDDLGAGAIGGTLLDRGYELLRPTRVMTAPVTRNRAWPDLPAGYRLERLDRLTEDVLAVSEDRVAEFGATARLVLEGPSDQAFLCAYDDSGSVGVVRVPIHDGWGGLFGLHVLPAHRNRGLGARLTDAALAFASQRGASAMYLQVTEDNTAARSLYGSAGFTDHHDYCYLRGSA
jgi:ribosomal protein S18 acetylase RimI-like enzyme